MPPAPVLSAPPAETEILSPPSPSSARGNNWMGAASKTTGTDQSCKGMGS